MPMQYEYTAIPESAVPRAANPVFQHLLDTYASETSKVVSVWREFTPEDMSFKSADRSSSVLDIMKHQLLSERRFFAEFIGLPGEPEAAAVLPLDLTPQSFCKRNEELCLPRLARMAGRDQNGGWKKSRSLTSDASAYGSSGDGCCTPRIIAHS